MDAIVNQIAKATGLDPAIVSKGLELLLGFLKTKLSPEVFAQIQSQVPGAGAPSSGGGGLMDIVSNIAGQVLGGQAGDAAGLLAQLGQAGVSGDQVAKFLPSAMDALQGGLTPEAQQEFAGLIPDIGGLLGPSTSGP